MKYWIILVSKDHISRGIAGGFVQANHGKQAPLRRMAAGDWVIIYSPKPTMNGTEPLQAFTAIGQLADDEVYQHKMSEDFIPYRRNVNSSRCTQIPILPLVNELDFIPNKKSWGYPFRFGFFEINGHDFGLIKTHMLKDEPISVNDK